MPATADKPEPRVCQYRLANGLDPPSGELRVLSVASGKLIADISEVSFGMPVSEDSGARDLSLPPTNELRWEQFEDFTEAVLSAHRFANKSGRRIARVSRWGRRGDKQDGIDFEGEWSDGTTSSWQCKAYDRLQPADVRSAVEACSFDADIHYLVCSGFASPAVRQEIQKHVDWTLIDRRDLNQLLADVPLHRRREILDSTWDRTTRKRLLRMPGADAFESVDALGDTRICLPVLNDAGAMVNRTAELQALHAAVRGDTRIILISAPGGMGKTRLAVEVLRDLQNENPTVPVLSLIPAHPLSADSLDELPHSSAVLFVDDGHERPDAVQRLLEYMLRNEHTKLVVAARKNGVTPLLDTFMKAGFPISGVTTIDLSPLNHRHAYELIDSLADRLDVQLAYGTKVNIARLAEEAPYLGVLAINAIQNGTLTGSLTLSTDLRSAVRSSYRQSITATVNEFDPALVERFLATCAATGGVIDLNNTEARAAINEFCGLSDDESNRLLSALVRADVLTKTESILRLVPDLLADMMLETASVTESLCQRSNFVPEVWRSLYPLFGAQLLRRLTDLDWRLRRQDLPGVVDGIWQTLRDEIASTDVIGLHEAVQRLAALSYTQPHGLMPLLAEVRNRLADLANLDEVPPPPKRGPLTATHFEQEERRTLRMRELTATDVEIEMAPLLAQCARIAPELLEQALDGLWALHRKLAPVPAMHPDAATKALEALAELGRLPDVTVPQRIIDRVKTWLSTYAPTPKAYPLFALKPLLSKQGETAGQTAPRVVSFNTYLINAAWARPTRDAIREILLESATTEHVGLAAEAVQILKSALRPPQALYGFNPTADDLEAWDSDDLATITILATIAAESTSPVIRRLVRESVSWQAQHASCLQIRCLAIEMATSLDNHGDELADALMGSHHFGLPDRYGQTAPSIADLESGLDVGTSRPDDEDFVDYIDRERDALLARCWDSLWQVGDIPDVLDRLEHTVFEVLLADSSQSVPFLFLGRYLAINYAERCSAVLKNIAARPPGPLDDLLVDALAGWSTFDKNKFGNWLDDSPRQRDAVRSAIGDAINTNSWTDLGGPHLAAYSRGVLDAVPAVRAKFHAGAHRLLAQDPVSTTKSLIATGIDQLTSTRLIESACRFGRADWMQGLDEPAVTAILALARRSDLSAHGVQGALACIARGFPREVLTFLLTCCREDGAILVDQCGDYPQAFTEQSEAVASWVFDQIASETDGIGDVLKTAVGETLYGEVAEALALGIEHCNINEIRGILEVFEPLDYWPLHAPLLADELITRTREVDASHVENVLAAIRISCEVRLISWVNGRSEELEHLFDLATKLSNAEFLDTELCTIYRSSANEIHREIVEIASRYNNDSD